MTLTNESGLIPCGHRIVVLPVVEEEQSAGGIYIPPEIRSREDMAQIRATVIAVGPSAWADQKISGQWAKVGDQVVIARYAGLFHKKGGAIYRVINDLDIVGVLSDE